MLAGSFDPEDSGSLSSEDDSLSSSFFLLLSLIYDLFSDFFFFDQITIPGEKAAVPTKKVVCRTR